MTSVEPVGTALMPVRVLVTAKRTAKLERTILISWKEKNCLSIG